MECKNMCLEFWVLEEWVWTFQEQIEAYKAKKKAIDAAPIKKVAEAKARKKRKVSTGFGRYLAPLGHWVRSSFTKSLG